MPGNTPLMVCNRQNHTNYRSLQFPYEISRLQEAGTHDWLAEDEERHQDDIKQKGNKGNDGPYNAEYNYVYSLVTKSQPLSLAQKPLDAKIANAFVKGLDIIPVPTLFKHPLRNQRNGQDKEQLDTLCQNDQIFSHRLSVKNKKGYES